MTNLKEIINNVFASQTVQIFIVLAIIFSVFHLVSVPYDEFPKLIVEEGVIIGVYPDADVAKVEEELTLKVKTLVYSFDEVDTLKTYSVSNKGNMVMYVELKSNVVDNERFWDDMKEKLADLQASLYLEASIKNQ